MLRAINSAAPNARTNLLKRIGLMSKDSNLLEAKIESKNEVSAKSSEKFSDILNATYGNSQVKDAHPQNKNTTRDSGGESAQDLIKTFEAEKKKAKQDTHDDQQSEVQKGRGRHSSDIQLGRPGGRGRGSIDNEPLKSAIDTGNKSNSNGFEKQRNAKEKEEFKGPTCFYPDELEKLLGLPRVEIIGSKKNTHANENHHKMRDSAKEELKK